MNKYIVAYELYECKGEHDDRSEYGEPLKLNEKLSEFGVEILTNKIETIEEYLKETANLTNKEDRERSHLLQDIRNGYRIFGVTKDSFRLFFHFYTNAHKEDILSEIDSGFLSDEGDWMMDCGIELKINGSLFLFDNEYAID